jgi:hypothetical protein
VIADLSVNHVERQVLLCGYSVERVWMDYGIDLIVHTYNRRGEAENGRVLFQVKATDRIRRSKDSVSVLCRLETVDLRFWSGETMPVIVVHYDAMSDLARYVHVQRFLAGHPTLDLRGSARRVTVAIPSSEIFDQKTMKEIARVKNKIVATQLGESHDQP